MLRDSRGFSIPLDAKRLRPPGNVIRLDYHSRLQSNVPMASADISRDLEPQRGYLLRVARLQLRDEALAEDVVQETLLAALVRQRLFRESRACAPGSPGS